MDSDIKSAKSYLTTWNFLAIALIIRIGLDSGTLLLYFTRSKYRSLFPRVKYYAAGHVVVNSIWMFYPLHELKSWGVPVIQPLDLLVTLHRLWYVVCRSRQIDQDRDQRLFRMRQCSARIQVITESLRAEWHWIDSFTAGLRENFPLVEQAILRSIRTLEFARAVDMDILVAALGEVDAALDITASAGGQGHDEMRQNWTKMMVAGARSQLAMLRMRRMLVATLQSLHQYGFPNEG